MDIYVTSSDLVQTRIEPPVSVHIQSYGSFLMYMYKHPCSSSVESIIFYTAPCTYPMYYYLLRASNRPHYKGECIVISLESLIRLHYESKGVIVSLGVHVVLDGHDPSSKWRNENGDNSYCLNLIIVKYLM